MYIVPSGEFRFEWDLAKAARNARKHGVSFDEAQGVFFADRVIRLISARKATRSERAQYNAQFRQ